MRKMVLVTASRFVWWCESKWAKEHRLDGVGTPEWKEYQRCFLMIIGDIPLADATKVADADVADVVDYIVDLMIAFDPIEFAECYSDRDEAVAEVSKALDVAPWTLVDMIDDMSAVSPSAMGIMAEYDRITMPQEPADDVVEYLAQLLVEFPKRFIRGLLNSSPWRLVEMLSEMGDDGSAVPIVDTYNQLMAVA